MSINLREIIDNPIDNIIDNILASYNEATDLFSAAWQLIETDNRIYSLKSDYIMDNMIGVVVCVTVNFFASFYQSN